MQLGEVLRAARVAAGLSLSELSGLTHFSKALLGHLETGRRGVLPEHVRAYEEALGVPIDVSGEALGATDVELVRHAVDNLTAVGLRHGGLAALGLVSAQWNWAQGLLAQTMTDRTRDDLMAQSSRLVDRLAWSYADTGRTRQAVKTFDVAVNLAENHWITRSTVLVNLANHHARMGAPDKALTVLDALGTITPVVDFTAESARARAYAMLGDKNSTLRHIGLADEAHALTDLRELPGTHAPFASGHEAHADHEAGKSLALLAEQGNERARADAVERLNQALLNFGPERQRARLKCEKLISRLGDR